MVKLPPGQGKMRKLPKRIETCCDTYPSHGTATARHPYSVSTLLSSCSSTVEVGVDTVSSGAVFIGNEEAVESDKLESDGCLVVQ